MTTHTPLSNEEIARRAQEVYERDIRPLVEDKYDGKIIVIDVTTGDYEMDDVGYKASERLRQRHPGAVLFGLRICYDAVEAFGGNALRHTKEVRRSSLISSQRATERVRLSATLLNCR